jgi:hypothetical protein
MLTRDLVYCKNIPVEFASLASKTSLLNHEFPSACKAPGQRFGCVLTKPLFSASSYQPSRTPPLRPTANVRTNSGLQPDNVINPSPNRTPRKDSNRPLPMQNKPLVSSELSSIVELAAVAVTQFDCLRFVMLKDYDESNTSYAAMNRDVLMQGKRLISERLQQQPSLGVNIFPMFEWIVIDQQCFDMSSVQRRIHGSDSAANAATIDVKLSKQRLCDNEQQTNDNLKVFRDLLLCLVCCDRVAFDL